MRSCSPRPRWLSGSAGDRDNDRARIHFGKCGLHGRADVASARHEAHDPDTVEQVIDATGQVIYLIQMHRISLIIGLRAQSAPDKCAIGGTRATEGVVQV